MAVPVIDEAAGVLRVTAPGMAELTVKLSPDEHGALRQVNVFKVTTDGWDEGNEAAVWFSAYLKGDYRLVRKARTPRRLIEKYMPDENLFSYTTQTAFADNWPFLIAAEESVADVQSRTPEGAKLPTMRNFRPNIVVKGGGAFAVRRHVLLASATCISSHTASPRARARRRTSGSNCASAMRCCLWWRTARAVASHRSIPSSAWRG